MPFAVGVHCATLLVAYSRKTVQLGLLCSLTRNLYSRLLVLAAATVAVHVTSFPGGVGKSTSAESSNGRTVTENDGVPNQLSYWAPERPGGAQHGRAGGRPTRRCAPGCNGVGVPHVGLCRFPRQRVAGIVVLRKYPSGLSIQPESILQWKRRGSGGGPRDRLSRE